MCGRPDSLSEVPVSHGGRTEPILGHLHSHTLDSQAYTFNTTAREAET